MKKINKKLLIVFICLAVFVIAFVIVFKYYDVSNTLGFYFNCLNDPIHGEIAKYDKILIDDGHIVYFMFSLSSGFKRNNIHVYIRTIDCKKYFYIEKLVFKIGDEESVVFYRKSFKLDENPRYFEYEGKKYIKYMSTFIKPSEMRTYFSKIKLFKDRKIEGNKFNMKMIAYYSFDDEEIQSSEYLYEVSCHNRGYQMHVWLQYLIYHIMGVND